MKLSPFLHTFLEYAATFLWFGSAFIDHFYCVDAAHDVCPLFWSFGILVSIAVLTSGSVLGLAAFFGSIRLCRDHICLTVLEGFFLTGGVITAVAAFVLQYIVSIYTLSAAIAAIGAGMALHTAVSTTAQYIEGR